MVVLCLGEWRICQEIGNEVKIGSFVITLYLHLCMMKACSSVDIRMHCVCEYDGIFVQLDCIGKHGLFAIQKLYGCSPIVCLWNKCKFCGWILQLGKSIVIECFK
jgi:hypothetical protein